MSSSFEYPDLAAVALGLSQMPDADAAAAAHARERNAQLTKPAGSLGRLEEMAIWYGAWRGVAKPAIKNPQVLIFAGNHGVAARGISAFPVEVTAQMVGNFAAGGAAINQICKAMGAGLSVHPIELDRPTQDFTTGPAMSEEDCLAALKLGWDSVDPKCDLLVTGEMGIGNTTAAAAMALALFGGQAEDWAGRGTGLDDAGVSHKAAIVRKAVSLNRPDAPMEVLRALGGREIAAMTGAILRARFEKIPVLLDGFICCAAAAVLFKINPAALTHCQAGHVSAEGAHANLLKELGLEPILSLGMRLGEASGGALAIGVLRGAIACHSGMATFAEADVTEKST